MTGLALAGCAVAGLVLGAIGSSLTSRYLHGGAPRVLSAWWLGAFLTGAVLVLLALSVGARGELAVYAVVAVVGVPLAIVDWVEHRLPRVLIWMLLIGVAVGFAVLGLARNEWVSGLRAVLAMLALLGVFLALALLVPGGVGAGDVRLAGATGLVSGWSGWPVVAGALLVALLLALLLLLLPHLPRRQHRAEVVGVPFGPCLLAGVLIAVSVAAG